MASSPFGPPTPSPVTHASSSPVTQFEQKWNAWNEERDAKDAASPTVLVVGLGFAGINVVKGLASDDRFHRIIAVDPKAYFEFTPGTIRAAAVLGSEGSRGATQAKRKSGPLGSISSMLTNNYTHFLYKNPKSDRILGLEKQYSDKVEIVCGRVTYISPTPTTTHGLSSIAPEGLDGDDQDTRTSRADHDDEQLQENEYQIGQGASGGVATVSVLPVFSDSSMKIRSIRFDYVVICTGSPYTIWKCPEGYAAMRVSASSLLSSSRESVKVRKIALGESQVSSAAPTRHKLVKVVGAGVVGVELCADIAHFCPGTVIHLELRSTKDCILPTYPKSARDYVMRHFEKLGNRFKIVYANPNHATTTNDIRNKPEDDSHYDQIFQCYVKTPHDSCSFLGTDYVNSATGNVVTNNHLQVVEQTTGAPLRGFFAVGECVDIRRTGGRGSAGVDRNPIMEDSWLLKRFQGGSALRMRMPDSPGVSQNMLASMSTSSVSTIDPEQAFANYGYPFVMLWSLLLWLFSILSASALWVKEQWRSNAIRDLTLTLYTPIDVGNAVLRPSRYFVGKRTLALAARTSSKTNTSGALSLWNRNRNGYVAETMAKIAVKNLSRLHEHTLAAVRIAPAAARRPDSFSNEAATSSKEMTQQVSTMTTNVEKCQEPEPHDFSFSSSVQPTKMKSKGMMFGAGFAMFNSFGTITSPSSSTLVERPGAPASSSSACSFSTSSTAGSKNKFFLFRMLESIFCFLSLSAWLARFRSTISLAGKTLCRPFDEAGRRLSESKRVFVESLMVVPVLDDLLSAPLLLKRGRKSSDPDKKPSSDHSSSSCLYSYLVGSSRGGCKSASKQLPVLPPLRLLSLKCTENMFSDLELVSLGPTDGVCVSGPFLLWSGRIVVYLKYFVQITKMRELCSNSFLDRFIWGLIPHF
ncbi:unnamed protein product [Amoebophrya sp. A25]|nr:unnamed protein product [Amoebophrya sp. A25]|eukprot:GSA25T00013722001.1